MSLAYLLHYKRGLPQTACWDLLLIFITKRLNQAGYWVLLLLTTLGFQNYLKIGCLFYCITREAYHRTSCWELLLIVITRRLTQAGYRVLLLLTTLDFLNYLNLAGLFIAFTREANHRLHALGLTHNYLELGDPEQCNNLLG